MNQSGTHADCTDKAGCIHAGHVLVHYASVLCLESGILCPYTSQHLVLVEYLFNQFFLFLHTIQVDARMVAMYIHSTDVLSTVFSRL